MTTSRSSRLWRLRYTHAALIAIVALSSALLLKALFDAWFSTPTRAIALTDLQHIQSGNSVALSGVVTLVDRQDHSFRVQDESGALRIAPSPAEALPDIGDRISIDAVLGSEYDPQFGLRSVHLTGLSFQVHGKERLPAAQSVAFADLYANMNMYDARLIESEAVVRSAHLEDGTLRLEVADSSSSMPVTIWNADSLDFSSLIDARVKLRGIVHLNQPNAAMPAAMQLIVPSATDLSVVEAAPPTPVHVPSLRSLLTQPDWMKRGHRVSVNGRIVRVESAHWVVIGGASGEESLRVPVESYDAGKFAAGDIVEAIGWPANERFTVMLRQATVQRAEHLEPVPAGTLPVMTSVAQVRTLDNTEAGKQYPIHVEAVLTAVNHARHFYFMQGGEQGIYVDSTGQSIDDLQVGQRVLVEGLTASGGFAPVIRHPNLKVIGSGTLPVPLQIDAERAPTGVYESRWVEVEGVVRPVTVTDSYFSFNIEADFGTVGAVLVNPGQNFKLEKLLDARVRARGVMSAAFTSQGALNGYRLFIDSPAFIETLRAAANIKLMPAKPISDLMRFSVDTERTRRARVAGVVTMRMPGEIYLQDESGSIRVQTAALNVWPGEIIKAVGYPEPSEHGLILADAIVTRSGAKQQLAPMLVTPEQIMKGDMDNRLVELEARILTIGSSATQQTLVLKSGFTTFNAQLTGGTPLTSLREGSLVHVVGIADVQRQRPVYKDYDFVPVSFRVLMRTPQDVQVIRTAPWWNLQRVWPLVTLLVLCISLSMLWVTALRRRVRAQTAEIDAQRTFLRKIIDMCPNFIFVKDRAGRYTLANRAMAQSHGYATEEILEKTDADICRAEAERQARERDDQEVIQSRAEKVVPEEVHLDSRGQTHWLYTVKQPLFNEAGEVTHIVGIANDITLHKQAENTLQKAREAAEAANRAKSEFLANMSHEIRTPLNGIIGMTDLCMDTDLNGEQREYLDTVKLSADGLLGVINDVLDFSKIEAGKLELDPIDFDLADAVELTLKTLALRAHQKGLELTCDIGSDVPQHLFADVNRLRQVLLNLAGNAIKFTAHGEVVVRVGVDAQEGDAFLLHFTVADTGIGIPADRIDEIFSPFTQADSSTTRRFGGTGLGLTICSRLVTMMGGRIWVESTPGHGSQFHFTVRMMSARNPELLDKQTPDLGSLAGIRVLIVDDNRTNRKILIEAVSRWGMRALSASSALEALQQISAAQDEQDPVRLVLTDMNMPEMDGLSMVERIIDRPDLIAPVIMMLTSSGQREDAARCRRLGIQHYLVKPIRLNELRESIVRLFARAQTASQVQRAASTKLTGDRALNILLAEDNAVNQTLMVRLLTKRGHRVSVAGDGRAALEAVEKTAFDLVLMDVQMPEMDGYEVTRWIRLRERGTENHLPVVALTAHAMTGDRERCEAAGMDGYLTKPIDPKKLDAMLTEFGGGGEIARSA